MKYLWTAFVFSISLIIFMILEYGHITLSISEIIQPLFFASIVTLIFLRSKLRRYIFWFSSTLLILMIILYIFNLLLFANWVGGLGAGIMVILITSYLPEIIKKGYIEKF